MLYKLIILAPSAGGKSTLMRYLRDNTDLAIAETDEEVMKANGNIWPDNELKNTILVPKTTIEVISRPKVIYFVSYIPEKLLIEARSKGFKVVMLDLSIEELVKRNIKRMKTEGYADVSMWFQAQQDTFEELSSAGLIDVVIDGDRSIMDIANKIVKLAQP